MADKIITHPATPEYRENWERIFRKAVEPWQTKTFPSSNLDRPLKWTPEGFVEVTADGKEYRL